MTGSKFVCNAMGSSGLLEITVLISGRLKLVLQLPEVS